ncbi:MAG: HD domain-containing protein [Bacteroidia bacterium]
MEQNREVDTFAQARLWLFSPQARAAVVQLFHSPFLLTFSIHIPHRMRADIQTVLAQAPFPVLGQIAREMNLRVYAIGGYVRDLLLGRPSKDIDIVVEGRGIDLAKAFAQQTGTKVAVYENFGAAMVRCDDLEVEFVGARRESYRRDSRKPIVEAGTLHEDQLRRDFTINALSISLNPDTWGELIDPFGGIGDLEARIIRTPTDPEITLSDDPLRMMRGIRFATQLGFSIEPRTYQAMSALHDRIDIISQERINDELTKIIMADLPSTGFKMLFQTGLLAHFFPELVRMHGVEYMQGRGHKDNFYHTLQVLDNVAAKSDNLWLRWVALLHDIAKPLTKRYDPAMGWTFHGHEDKGARMVPKIFRRMKLPLGEPLTYVEKLVRLHQRPIALVSEEVSDSAIRRIVVDAGEDLDDLLDFCRADITSRNEHKVQQFLANYDALALRIREVQERDNLRNWQPPVTGDMIMAAFNIPPSRTVGLIKHEVCEAILEGIIPNEAAAAVAYMHEVAPRLLAQYDHLRPDDTA